MFGYLYSRSACNTNRNTDINTSVRIGKAAVAVAVAVDSRAVAADNRAVARKSGVVGVNRAAMIGVPEMFAAVAQIEIAASAAHGCPACTTPPAISRVAYFPKNRWKNPFFCAVFFLSVT